MELMGETLALLPVRTALAAEESGLGALGINLPNLIWQIVAFLILLFVLSRFAYGPLLKIIDERRARAQEIIEKSDQMKKEALESEARTREILNNAQREAQTIIASATARQQQIVEDTAARQRQAEEQEIAKARQQIAAERDQAIQQLRREFADLTITAATQVVGRELQMNPQLQTQLINDVLTQQGQSGNGPTPPKIADGRRN